jgi:prepilin-type N-terminal cleavage/methylation domain-containing protein
MTPHPSRANARFCHRRAGTAPVTTDTQSDERGFTFIEVIVSMGLFVVVAGAALVGIVNAISSAHVSQQRIDAANVAQADLAGDIATVRNDHVPSNSADPGYPVAVKNEEFNVVRCVTVSGGESCADGSCAPGKTVTVNVSVYQQQSQRFLARSDTVIAC